MADKVVPITRGRKPIQLSTSQYPRMTRENSSLLDLTNEQIFEFFGHYGERLLSEVQASHPEDDYRYGATKPEPFDEMVGVVHVYVGSIIPRLNNIALYRILKSIYGPPDIVGGLVSVKRNVFHILDWSFTIHISDDLYAEIRSIDKNQKSIVQIWHKRGDGAEAPKKDDERILRFIECMVNTYEKRAANEFQEQSSIENSDGIGFANLFLEKLTAGEKLYELATKLSDEFIDDAIFDDDENPIITIRYLYAAATMMYIVAAEALINILYHFLLKEELRHRNQPVKIERGLDFEAKIIQIHLLCDGFSKPALTMPSELLSKFSEIRDYRNDIIHGKISDEHKIYTILEDGLMFFYSPATDYRGKKRESKTSLSRSIFNIWSKHPEECKSVVLSLKEAFFDAMDVPTRNWAEAWISELAVCAPTAMPRSMLKS